MGAGAAFHDHQGDEEDIHHNTNVLDVLALEHVLTSMVDRSTSNFMATESVLAELNAQGIALAKHLLQEFCDTGGLFDLKKALLRLSLETVHFSEPAALAVLEAVAARRADDPDHRFQDEDFPPEDQSLGLAAAKAAGAYCGGADHTLYIWRPLGEIQEDAKGTTKAAFLSTPQQSLKTFTTSPPGEMEASQAGSGISACTVTLFDGDPDPNTVLEGSLADCFFIAAVSAVAARPRLLRQAFLSDAGERGGDALAAGGAVACSFFQDGRWRAVPVDLWVPCTAGSTTAAAASGVPSRPAFGRTRRSREAWLTLLEKAYAKLYGSYAAISGGNVSEALRDLTGCCVLDYSTEHPDVRRMIQDGSLWSTLYSRHQRGQVLMGCAWTVNPEKGAEAWQLKDGLLPNHAYAITGMRCEPADEPKGASSAQTNGKESSAATKGRGAERGRGGAPRDRTRGGGRSGPTSTRGRGGASGRGAGAADNKRGSLGATTPVKNATVRLRNPWGNQIWDRSAPLPGGDEGEFEMPFDAFCRLFNRIYACVLGTAPPRGGAPAGVAGADAAAPPPCVSRAGVWAGAGAGGCTDFPSWRHNPLFLLRGEPHPPPGGGRAGGGGGGGGEEDTVVHVVLNVSQPDCRRRQREQAAEVAYEPIGITIVAMHPEAGPMMTQGNYDLLGRSAFWNKRDVAHEVAVPAGLLARGVLAVPSTHAPGREGAFWLTAAAPPAAAGAPVGRTREHQMSLNLEPFSWDNEFPYSVTVKGQWKGETAGGRLGSTRPNAWKNPRYFLKSECLEEFVVYIFLRHNPPSKKKTGEKGQLKEEWYKTGTYALKTIQSLAKLKETGVLGNEHFLGEFKFTNLGETTRPITIAPVCPKSTKDNNNKGEHASLGMAEEKQDKANGIYCIPRAILMPATFEEGLECEFDMLVMSKVPIQIEQVHDGAIPKYTAELEGERQQQQGGRQKKSKRGGAPRPFAHNNMNVAQKMQQAHDANMGVADLYGSLGI